MFHCVNQPSQKNVTDTPFPPPPLTLTFIPGGEDSALQQSLLTEGGGVGVLEGSSQAPGDQWEGELKNLDGELNLLSVLIACSWSSCCALLWMTA